MQHEIIEIENNYHDNLQRLEQYLQEMSLNIRKWRISTYKRNWYSRYLKNWREKQIQYLGNTRDHKIQEIKNKYSLNNI